MVEFNSELNHLKNPSGKVDKISLRGNQLRSINSTIFDEVIGLKIVDLSENNISQIPARIFQKTLDLVSINLNKNNLTSLDGRIFERLENLRKLNVKNNFIHTLQNNFLSDELQKLESIDFENNLLRVVEPNAVPRGVFDALKKINLCKNKLRDVPQFGLYVRNLVTFDLSYNEINFAGFVKMIDELNEHDFLFLHTDTGSSIDTTSTRDLTTNSRNKKTFNLQGNAIERFDLNEFGKLRMEKLESVLKIFKIILGENPLHCDCKTRGLLSSIRYWTTAVKEITEKDFESWICYTPVNLRGKKILDVHQNQLWCERRNCSKCPKRCTCYHQGYPGSATLVDCRERNLTTVPEELPGGVIELNIEHNQIGNLNLSKHLENVSVIHASHNKIERVTLDDSKLKLKELYLYSNKLTTLPKRIQNLTLSKINIQNNYFTCDCENLWMKNWLKRERNAFIGGAKSVGCSSGDRNQGKPLILVEDSDFICVQDANTGENPNESIAAISSFVVAGFLVVVIITAVLLYRFRKELKLILYTRFNWHPFDRVDDSDPSKIYDAFVSFNERDKVWVEETLQEKLEKDHNPPYKLCVHYRDFIPGAPIAETILDCVKKSRRMIMVLSRNFIQSEWCMLEFRAAHLRVLKGRANYLIVVLFDDVDVDSLDDELKLYLKTNTYLTVESKWFWQQLKYALPQKKLETGDEGLRNEGIEFEERHLGMV
ncbi:protein toll-like [Dendronephthya gigantea]|uniref:protein toll-like n=1 Tax=Dendronephthya gigantea TaxID=151771 RepID=UPI00106C0899|nr:protein toll-like [Dendronephthya gigantea]